MSAAVYWEPVKPPKGHRVKTGTPSWLLGAFESAFGRRYPNLTTSDIPVLRGMMAAAPNQRETFEQLVDAISDHGEIRIWAEY